MENIEVKKNKLTHGLSATFKKNRRWYYADLSYVMGYGNEMMIFPADENGKVTCWGEKFLRYYDSVTEENLLSGIREFMKE